MNGDVFVGIDVGSSSTESVILGGDGTILGFSIVQTGANSTDAANVSLDQALEAAHGIRGDIRALVATGYGRISIPFADRKVTEITCHAHGAFHLFPNVGTVIDLGGQDSKVIYVGKGGKVMDFNMNDKCAAGTGRFLEVMADKLQVSLDDMGPLSLAAGGEVQISSVCTVFAESEVVSLVAQNHPKDEIIRGLHKAIVNRIFGMVKSIGVHGEVAMTGGVAKNSGVVRMISEKLGKPILVYDEPRIVGALGAALLALKDFEK